MVGRVGKIALLVFTAWVMFIGCDTENSVDPVYQQYYIKYYGEDGDQEGNDFVVNADGTVMILGTTTQGNTSKVYLVKVDAQGNEIFKKSFNPLVNEQAIDIELIQDGPDAGNYVILSNVQKNDVDLDIRLTIINSNGDSLKSILFNQLQSQEGRSVTPLADGGYFLSGTTTDTDTNDAANAGLPNPTLDVEDLFIVRFQSDLTYFPFNVTRVGGSYLGAAIKIFQVGNEFYYAGDSDALTSGNLPDNNTYESNMFFRKFVSNPSAVSSIYSGTLILHEKMNAIASSPSGLFMAVGTQEDATGSNKRLYAATITNNFSAIQTEGIIDTTIPREAVAISSAGASRFLVLANEFNAALNRDIYLRKTNALFEADFEVRFGSPNNDDTGSAVTELPNGDILVLGTMQITNQKKIALIKLQSNGKF